MQIPVPETILAACRDTWEGRRDIAALAFLPILGMSVFATIKIAVMGNIVAEISGMEISTETPPDVLVGLSTKLFFNKLLDSLVSLVFYTLFAVAWYRRNLIGPEAVTVGVAMRWSQRHWYFLRRLVLLLAGLMGLIFVATILLGAIFPGALAFSAVLIAVGLIYARIMLVLPAAALDTPMTIADSAKLTTGNGWRIFLAVMLTPLIIMLLGALAVWLLASPVADLIHSSITAQFLVHLVGQSINYFGYAVGIAALSMVYRRLTT